MFNPLKDLKNLGMSNGLFAIHAKGFGNFASSNDLSGGSFTQQANMQMMAAIEKCRETGEVQANEDIEMLKKLSMVKHKETLRETLLEFQRKGSYVCIYPSKGS